MSDTPPPSIDVSKLEPAVVEALMDVLSYISEIRTSYDLELEAQGFSAKAVGGDLGILREVVDSNRNRLDAIPPNEPDERIFLDSAPENAISISNDTGSAFHLGMIVSLTGFNSTNPDHIHVATIPDADSIPESLFTVITENVPTANGGLVVPCGSDPFKVYGGTEFSSVVVGDVISPPASGTVFTVNGDKELVRCLSTAVEYDTDKYYVWCVGIGGGGGAPASSPDPFTVTLLDGTIADPTPATGVYHASVFPGVVSIGSVTVSFDPAEKFDLTGTAAHIYLSLSTTIAMASGGTLPTSTDSTYYIPIWSGTRADTNSAWTPTQILNENIIQTCFLI